MARVLIPLANGFEELEAVTVIDLLRRASVEVVTAGLEPGPVTGSRQTMLMPDAELEVVLEHNFDMIVLPGGMPGAKHLAEDARVTKLVRDMAAADKFVCAICAAPKVLAQEGLLDGKRMTAYPQVVTAEEFPRVNNTGAAVEHDGKIITSRGPGTAMDFALALIETLCGASTRDRVEAGLVRS